MKLTRREWEIFDETAELVAELDDILKEIGGMAQIMLNGNVDDIDVFASIPPRRGEDHNFWFEHRYFYLHNTTPIPYCYWNEAPEAVRAMMGYCIAHLPNWKEELK